MDPAIITKQLKSWFASNQRDLPWRKTKDPYKIWISETMLQQTTSTAVIPFFNKFIQRFPTVKSLAEAKLEDVYEYWAGLGYYSRARNLHKAAILLDQFSSFPKTHEELIKLPGFGPYTSRSVSSIAFNEPVGVIDGNVIRVLSRFTAKPYRWWETTDRMQLQDIADSWAEVRPSAIINQAVMELGATICLPKNPRCILCPISKSCLGLKAQTLEKYPIKKPKKTNVIIAWNIEVPQYKDYVGLQTNDYAPFLKKQSLYPGQIKTLTKPPKKYDFKHMITHYEIYVTVSACKKNRKLKKYQWVKKSDLKRVAPASVMQKALKSLHL